MSLMTIPSLSTLTDSAQKATTSYEKPVSARPLQLRRLWPSERCRMGLAVTLRQITSRIVNTVITTVTRHVVRLSSSDFTVNPSSVAKRRGVPGAIPHFLTRQTMKTPIKTSLVLAVLVTIASASRAAIPSEVDTALDSLGTDALYVAGAVLAAVVAVYAFKFILKGILWHNTKF